MADKDWAEKSDGNIAVITDEEACIGYQRNCPKPPALAMTSAVLNGTVRWIQGCYRDAIAKAIAAVTCDAPLATTDERAAILAAPAAHYLTTCTADKKVVRLAISELTGGADQFPPCPNGPPVNYTYRDSWDVTTSVPLTTGQQFVAGDVGYTGAPPGTWIVDWQETVPTSGQDGNTIQNLFLRKTAC